MDQNRIAKGIVTLVVRVVGGERKATEGLDGLCEGNTEGQDLFV